MARGEVGYMNSSEDKNKTDSVRVKKKKLKGRVKRLTQENQHCGSWTDALSVAEV